MAGHTDHRFVGGHFRQRAGIGLDPSTFIAVKVSLAFSDMECIGSGDFVEVASAVQIDVFGLRYGRLQRILATQAVQSAPCFNLVPVNRVDLFAS